MMSDLFQMIETRQKLERIFSFRPLSLVLYDEVMILLLFLASPLFPSIMKQVKCQMSQSMDTPQIY